MAAEALTSVLRYVFDALGKHRARAVTDAENHAAARLLRRLGFRNEAHFVDNVWYKGAWGSEFVFALFHSGRSFPCGGCAASPGGGGGASRERNCTSSVARSMIATLRSASGWREPGQTTRVLPTRKSSREAGWPIRR